MKHRKLNRVIAAVMFLSAAVVYIGTMAPTFSFWDCGEVIATAHTLGIPHPPGAPLFLMIGRIFSMLPFFHDVGARVNLISTIESASTVMLTYLIIVKFIRIYRGTEPDGWLPFEKISAYGGAAIGGFALAFSDSFWFNAVETGLWAASSFFTALIVWMMLCWYEEEPRKGHERWLLAVMYMIGLSIGVHLLCLLALFSLVLVYYFKKYDFTPLSFGVMVLVSVCLFFLIYRVIIKDLPVLVVRTSWWSVLAVIALLVSGIYHTHRKGMVLLNTGLLAVLLLIVGYTSYMLIFVRAHAGPPINENNPSTLDAFFSYVNREQYGEWPLWPRRWSPEPIHQEIYRQYASELDYFLSYQFNHMYLRYFGWQFIGRSTDMEGAFVDWSVLWGVPFLAGIAGAVAHFRRNWKMALVVTALFLATGLALVVYLNQTEPQPRERDYSYVASFFAFAIWIGIGFESLCSWLAVRLRVTGLRRQAILAAAVVTAGLVLCNGRMLQANYRSHDRSGNYVPWDWAWNILQSCEKDAILFTNGDNDTFPLWYLQEVERIRNDVRVVNLSLANTGWYLQELKNTRPRGALPIAFGMSDDELKEITYVPVDSVEVAVPAARQKRLLLQEAGRSGIALPSAPDDSLRWRIVPGMNYKGQGYFRPQDIAVFEIVVSNYGNRPICFALTAGPDNMIGLEKFLRLDGLVYKVVPMKSASTLSFVDPVRLYHHLMTTYRYRNVSKPGVNIEETSRNLCGNYQPLFVRLAIELAKSPDDSIRVDGPDGVGTMERKRGRLAVELLDTMGRLFPPRLYPVNPQIAGSVVSIYASEGEKQKADQYIAYLERLARQIDVRQDPALFFALARSYKVTGDARKAATIMARMKRELPGNKKQLDSLMQ